MTTNFLDFVIYRFIPFLCVVIPLFILLWHATSVDACNRTAKLLRSLFKIMTNFKKSLMILTYVHFLFSKKFNLIGEVVELNKEDTLDNENKDVEIYRNPKNDTILYQHQPKLVTQYSVTFKIDNEYVTLDVNQDFFEKIEIIKKTSSSNSVYIIKCRTTIFSNVVNIFDVV